MLNSSNCKSLSSVPVGYALCMKKIYATIAASTSKAVKIVNHIVFKPFSVLRT